jgi:hypothetical protein
MLVGGDFFVVLTILTFFGNADSLMFIIECCLISSLWAVGVLLDDSVIIWLVGTLGLHFGVYSCILSIGNFLLTVFMEAFICPSYALNHLKSHPTIYELKVKRLTSMNL